jgi:hypothetical protein
VTTDLLMGMIAVAIGAVLLGTSGRLALLMKEGDDGYREHPVFSRFEPSSGPLATDEGRLFAFRAWVVVWAAGFVAVGAGLLIRAS